MYIESVKCYSKKSKWLAKLFLQFCHEYKCDFLRFNSSNSNGIFNWLLNYPNAIHKAPMFLEKAKVLTEYYRCSHTYYILNNTPHYRTAMWIYFLITHQEYIPKEFKVYLSEDTLIFQLKKLGAKNNDDLKKIFKTLKIKPNVHE